MAKLNARVGYWIVLGLALGLVTGNCCAQDSFAPQWIWSSEQAAGEAPQSSCYFRKTIHLPIDSTATVEIAADDVYELFVNGQSIGSGSGSAQFANHNVGSTLRKGKNVIAVRVDNRNGPTAGLAAKIDVTPSEGPPRVYMTNPTWRTSLRVLPLWSSVNYRDGRWKAARNLGTFGKLQLGGQPAVAQNPVQPAMNSERLDPLSIPPPTMAGEMTPNSSTVASSPVETITKTDVPPDNTTQKSGDSTGTAPDGSLDAIAQKSQGTPNTTTETVDSNGSEPTAEQSAQTEPKEISPAEEHPEFKVKPGFQIQHIAGDKDVGSLIAMTFNEFGQILASQEGGPLLMLYDSNKNGTPDKVRVCCNRVFSCQGILPISGKVYVVGDGPVGSGVYQLADENHDGDFESVTTLVRFEGKSDEHGPHGLTLGPDGMLYVAIGNHTKVTQPFSLSSPHQNYYEGDLTSYRYEDPRGHAQGIKAPGGGVIRIDLEGRKVELFAGGLRNAYDLAFSKDGEIFTHDSDMESDIGTPWHRPTRLINVIAGAEYGWRSGWAKWPDYLVDTLPAVVETGRGSPTGCVFYDHWAYPAKYRNVMFSCDWSQGQIKAFRFDRRGAGYAATEELFLEGKPLNVTDIEVGPDGWLYFCTGGRGTRGNIFRVVWSKDVPATQKDLGQGIVRAIRQPQMNSAWGRQAVSVLRRDMNEFWDRDIRTFVANQDNPPKERAHAMQMMHLLGPPPADVELRELSMDTEPLVRAKAAYLMGLIGNSLTSNRLAEMLRDETAFVRRQAAEALGRKEVQVEAPLLFGMMASPDRYEAWAARRLLERNTNFSWHDQVLAAKNPRVFAQGATAMLLAHPSREVALQITKRFEILLQGFLSDTDFVDCLRVVQLAVERGELVAADLPELTTKMVAEFPAGNIRINRELTRLLVFLKPASAVDSMLSYFDSDVPPEEKLHVGMHLAFFDQGMTADQRVRLMAYMETADENDGGANLSGYVADARRVIIEKMPTEHRIAALRNGDRLPKTAMAVLFAIPEEEDKNYIGILQDLDRRIVQSKGPAHSQLKVGILAVLARGGNPQAMGYLREVYDRDPERRQAVAMGLAQSPDGRNWDYLVRSVPLLEGEPAREVLVKLTNVSYAPEDPEHIRQIILCGLRLGDDGADDAIRLLQHWVGTTPDEVGQTWQSKLTAWQNWFEKSYPARPVATLPVESGDNRWTYDDLLTFLSSSEGSTGSITRGAAVYAKAQCAQCHIHGAVGTSAGPELTTLSRRFQVREALESIIYPSQVISDQYASHTIITTDGKQIQGLVLDLPNSMVKLVPAQGDPVMMSKDEIDEILPNNTSAMPEGLLNDLSLQEIADLFAFMMNVPETAVANQPPESSTR